MESSSSADDKQYSSQSMICLSNDNKNDEEEPEFQQMTTPSSDDITTLKLGETMALNHLGPIILNKDGTTSRIHNFDKLTEPEKEVACRRIKKRNSVRREAI